MERRAASAHLSPDFREGVEALWDHDPPDEVVGRTRTAYFGTSFLCLRPGTEPRRSAIFLVESTWFEPVMLATILTNCVMMALDSPLDPTDTWKASVIHNAEDAFIAIFTFELVCKVLVNGFLTHEGAYLRDPWNQLDFVVVSLAWAPVLIPDIDDFTAFRSVRALRPLRALKHLPGMRALVGAILATIPKLGGVLLLCTFIFLLFAILAVELFEGQLHYRCALPGFSQNVLSQRDFDTGIVCSPRSAQLLCPSDLSCEYFSANPDEGLTSFDSTPGALFVLLRAITFNDWTAPMYQLMASLPPIVPIAYFVTVIIFGGFYVVNLFLAVTFDEFLGAVLKGQIEEIQEAIEKQHPSLRKETSPGWARRTWTIAGGKAGTIARCAGMVRRWSMAMPSDSTASDTATAELLSSTAARSDGGSMVLEAAPSLCARIAAALAQARGQLPTIVSSRSFDRVAMGMVLVNTLVMCLPYAGMSDDYGALLAQASLWITWIFMLEMLLKLCGLGWSAYWSDGWNVLDGSIVSISVVEIIVSAYLPSDSGNTVVVSFVRTLRLVRVLRMLRLMRAWAGLYSIVNTFARAVQQMSNLLLLLFLITTMLALIGMQLFGGGFNASNGFAPANKPRTHFDYFYPAMLTSFTLSEPREPFNLA